MNLLKEITSSMKQNKREFERPINLDLENLKSLSKDKIKSNLIELDLFCEEILKKNRGLELALKQNYDQIDDWKKKHKNVLMVNKQLNQIVQTHNLDDKCVNVIKESLFKIFVDNPNEVAYIKKYFQQDSENKNISEKENNNGEHINLMFKKLIQAIDKLYLGKILF